MQGITQQYIEDYKISTIVEQMVFESFLDTVKVYAKDKLGKAVDTIKDWKDAAVVFSQVLSSKELLRDFLYPLERLVRKQLQKLYGILKKVKLDSVVKKIEEFFKKITSLDGWKKLFALIAIGGIALYAANKLPIDGIQSWITKTLGENFIETITSKLVDWKKYIGFLGPIVGGGAIIFKLLEPLLAKFKEALKSDSKWATRLIKENKNKMKKQQLKNLIKEEIKNILKEEDSPESSEVKIPSALIKLIKDLGVGDKITVVNQALALISKGKESELSRIQNEELAKIFIALLKNTDASLGNKFLQLSKQIK